jgi:hypothetical protein
VEVESVSEVSAGKVSVEEEESPSKEGAGESVVSEISVDEMEFVAVQKENVVSPTERVVREICACSDVAPGIPGTEEERHIVNEDGFVILSSFTSFSTGDQDLCLVLDSNSQSENVPSSFLLVESHPEPVGPSGRERFVVSKLLLEKDVEVDSQSVDGISEECIDDVEISCVPFEETGFDDCKVSVSDDSRSELHSDGVCVLSSLSSSSITASKDTCGATEEKDRVVQKSRKKQLLIGTHVTETEVKELMCEVREVTRQIKQEVRELKPDLTPTPEGKESSILPLSESREFVELTDLGCIKEEHIPFYVADERSQRAFQSYARDDTRFRTAVDENISETGERDYGFFPRSVDVALRVDTDIVPSKTSDVLTSVHDIEVTHIVSPTTEVRQKLGATEFELAGGFTDTVLDLGDIISEPPTRRVPEQDRRSDIMLGAGIVEEQVGTISAALTEQIEVTSEECHAEKKEILDEESVFLIETHTQSPVVLDYETPVICERIVAVSVSPEVPDRPTGSLSETEADKHQLSENESEVISAVDFPRDEMPSLSYIKKPLEVTPAEGGEGLPGKTRKKSEIDDILEINISDENSLPEGVLGKLPALEDKTEVQFPPSSIVKEQGIDRMQKMKLEFENSQYGPDVCETLLVVDTYDIHESHAARGSEDYKDLVFGDFPQEGLREEFAESGQSVGSRYSSVPDTLHLENVLPSAMEIGAQNLYYDSAVVTKVVQTKDTQDKCSEFRTAEDASRSGATMADVEKHIVQESRSADTDVSIIDVTRLAEKGTDFSAYAEFEYADIQLSAGRELQETELSLLTGTDISVTLKKEYISDTSFKDRQKLSETEPSSAAEDITCVVREKSLEESASVIERRFSCLDILSPDFVEPPQLVSLNESQISSQYEQSWETAMETATEGPIETSEWKLESDSCFGISADDIVMKDDLLEVTVIAEKAGSVGTDSHCAENVAEDLSQEAGAVRKESVKTKSKKKLPERQVQREATVKRAAKAPTTVTTTKKVDDRATMTRRSKEPDKIQQDIAVSSSGTVSRYRSYMASTLSRDLKVERSVAERSSYFNRESSVKRRVTTEREDSFSSTSPAKQPVPKQITTGAVPRSPQMITKSRRVESRSSSAEKEVQGTVAKKQVSISSHTKPSTSAVTTRSIVTREEKLVSSRTTARLASDITVYQKTSTSRDSSSSSVRQSHLQSSVKKLSAESDASQERCRTRRRKEPSKLTDYKRSDIIQQKRRADTDPGRDESPGPVPDSKLKTKVKEIELESRSELDSGDVSKPTAHSAEVSKTDDTVAVPVASSTRITTPAEHGIATSHSHIADFKDIAVPHTLSPPSAAPSPESSPSIKPVLGKSSAIASERSTRVPSPSPSASPVRAATSTSRSTERFDYSSHTPPSLPSSPSRVVRQTTSQVGVTQLLTSEVFTRTVDASGSIEVIYRQPTSSETLRRVAVVAGTRSSFHETIPGGGNTGAEGEVSLIDTTDSSLSDSVALPSSSSDHDLSVDLRLRTGGSPASPKPTRRSLDLIHDGGGPKLRTSDLLLDYSAVPSAAGSEQLAPDSSVPRLEGSSSITPLDAVPKTRTSTQVSEERLSPILDVRAVTPPRVKHKFQYEDDEEEEEEEEAVAVFLSSAGKTDDLPSAPTFHPSLIAAASVQSMASEIELLLQEVQMNMRSHGDWDSESLKLRVENLRSKTRSLKHFVNNELYEGKFCVGDNRYNEVDDLEFTIPEPQAIPCFPDGGTTRLGNLNSFPKSVYVHSHSQIVRDQFSGTGSSVEDSTSIQEVNYKQGIPTHGVVRFSLTVDSSDYILSEDEDIFDLCEEDIHTLSTSGSEVDYAVVESSSNPLAVIEEEAAAATDEDQELIPIDDIPVKKQNVDWEPDELSRRCSVTSESNSLSEHLPVFTDLVITSMAHKRDRLPFVAIPTVDGSDSDAHVTRSLGAAAATDILTNIELNSDTGEFKHGNGAVPSVDDGLTDFEFLETSDDDDDEPSVRPEATISLDNTLYFADGTEERIGFKGSRRSSVILSKVFAESSSFLNVHRTETESVTDVEDFVASADEDVHGNESDRLGTIEFLDEFTCGRETVDVKDKIARSPELSSSPAVTPEPLSGAKYAYEKGSLSSRIPSPRKKETKLSLPPQLSLASLSDSDVHLSDSDEEQRKQRHRRIKAPRGRPCSVNAVTNEEDLKMFENEAIKEHLSTDRQLSELVDSGPFTSSVSHELHQEQGTAVRSDLDNIASTDGYKSSYLSQESVSQNKFIVRLSVPESCIDSHTDTEDVEAGDEIRDGGEQNTDGAKSVIAIHLKEYGTVSVVNKSGTNGVNYTPSYIAREASTFTDLVEFDSERNDEVITLRTDGLHLPVSVDSTAEDVLEASDTYVRSYEKSPDWKKENNEMKFMCVIGEARSVAVTPGKILSMNTTSTTAESFITIVNDMQMSIDNRKTEGKPNLLAVDTDAGTLTDVEEFQIKPDEKIPKFRDVSSVKGDSHRVLEAGSEFRGLCYEVQSRVYTTDIEDLSAVSGDEMKSEISDIDGSTVEASEITSIQKKHKYSLLVDDIQEPTTDTEDLKLDCFPSGRRRKAKSKSRFISIKGDKPSITDVENLEVSDTEHSAHHMQALIIASKQHVDANTDVEDVDMAEEEYHKQVTSVTSDFMRHNYDVVAMKKGDGPFPAETQQVLSSRSFGASATKRTSPSPDMYSGITTDTEDVDVADSKAHLSYCHTEIATPVELGLHFVSTVHPKHAHKINIHLPDKVDHVKEGRDIQEVVTDVEELGIYKEELQHCHPEDHICVVDVEDKVRVCVAAENIIQDMVCICMGKRHEQLMMELKTSSGSATSHTGSWNATKRHEGTDCILELSSTTSCLSPSCIRADLPSMQVAVPRCHLTEPVGSTHVACSCVVSQDTGKNLVNVAASLHPSTAVSVSVICTPLGYRTLMNVMSLTLFVQSWAMLYVNNPVILEINVDKSGITVIRKNKASCVLVAKEYVKGIKKSMVSTHALPGIVQLDANATVSYNSLQFTPLSSRGRSGNVSKLISQFEDLSVHRECHY